MTLSLVAAGDPAPAIQWFKDGVPVAGATGPRLVFASVVGADMGSYTARVSNVYNGVTYNLTTSAAILVVNSTPAAITPIPVTRSTSAGGDVTYSVSVAGSDSLSFRWYRNGSQVSGANGPSITMRGVGSSETGDYRATVASRTVRAGQSATISVSATGSEPLTYQWYRDGIQIAGATRSSLTIGGVQSSDAGEYRVLVNNWSGWITELDAGNSITGFLRGDGTLWEVGRSSTAPVQVASGVASMSVGRAHTMFVKADGTLWGKGENFYAQLGDGTATNRNQPVQVASGAAEVVAGFANTLFRKVDGSLWGFGWNMYGQLGDGTTVNRGAAVQIANDVVAMAIGQGHILFVKGDGTLWGIGLNDRGQLGDGTTIERRSPVQVASGVSSVSAGSQHTAWVRTDGTLWATGRNDYGQLGDGTTIERRSPVQVASGVSSVSAGSDHTLYVKTGGSLWASGRNDYGQLGDGTTASRSTAVKVAEGVTRVAAGQWHSMFVKTDASLWGMGQDSWGYSGDGILPDRRTPVRAGGVLSDAEALVVHTLPIISAQPLGQNVVSDFSLTLTVNATGNPSPTFQWRKSGINIAGATGSSYNIPASTAADAGSYTVVVSNSVGSVTSAEAIVTIVPPAPAAILGQPSNANVVAGQPIVLSVTVGGSPEPAIQWFKNGKTIPGAINTSYRIESAALSDAGTYTASVGNVYRGSNYSLTTAAAVVTVTEPLEARLSNVSIRTTLGSGQQLIFGLTMAGGEKPVLMRAVGPGLASFGVSNAMPDPGLVLYQDQARVAANDDWSGSAEVASAAASVGAFPLLPASRDAALLRAFSGGRTLHVQGAEGGNVIVEAYDAGSGHTPRLTNVSARGTAGFARDTLIAGFSITGNTSKRILIRAVGPTLTTFKVAGALSDPKLEVFAGSNRIAENDNWSASLSSLFARVGAFSLDSGSRDAAIELSLAPGGYTVHVSPTSGLPGEALIEIYELP